MNSKRRVAKRLSCRKDGRGVEMDRRGVWSGRIAVLFIVLVLCARTMRAQTLYVLNCDGGSGVNVFSMDGTVLKKFIPLGGAACTAMAVDKAGRFYVGVAGNFNNVRVFNPDGKQIGSWNLGIGVGGLAIGPDGKIYVAGGYNGKIVIKNFNPDGSHAGLVINTDNFDSAKGLALDSSGNIYLATMTGLMRYDSTGKPIGKMFVVPRDNPRCVAIAPDGKFYAGYYLPVATFSPEGVHIQPSLHLRMPDGSQPTPTAVTVGKDGRVYVGYDSVARGKAVVAVFSPDGKMIGKPILTGGGVRGIYVQE